LPSPIVHSLAGLGLVRIVPDTSPGSPASRPIGWSFSGRQIRAQLPLVAALLLAGNAPDLDFVPGILIGDAGRFHHGPAHSLFAAAIFTALVLPLARRAGFHSMRRFGLLMALGFVSHLLLDMLSTDRGVRNGVPLFWPLSEASLSFPFAVFIDIKRDLRTRSFVQSLLIWHNVYAVLWECVVLTVLLAASRVGRLVRARVRGPAARQT